MESVSLLKTEVRPCRKSVAVVCWMVMFSAVPQARGLEEATAWECEWGGLGPPQEDTCWGLLHAHGRHGRRNP